MVPSPALCSRLLHRLRSEDPSRRTGGDRAGCVGRGGTGGGPAGGTDSRGGRDHRYGAGPSHRFGAQSHHGQPALTIVRSSTVLRPEAAARLESIGRADVMVGIPSFNNARTIGHVVRAIGAGLVKYFPGLTAVIV